MPTTDERLAALEAQQASQTKALRLILEGKWTGPLPTAAAEVDALMGGGVADFKPLAFPKVQGA